MGIRTTGVPLPRRRLCSVRLRLLAWRFMYQIPGTCCVPKEGTNGRWNHVRLCGQSVLCGQLSAMEGVGSLPITTWHDETTVQENVWLLWRYEVIFCVLWRVKFYRKLGNEKIDFSSPHPSCIQMGLNTFYIKYFGYLKGKLFWVRIIPVKIQAN